MKPLYILSLLMLFFFEAPSNLASQDIETPPALGPDVEKVESLDQLYTSLANAFTHLDANRAAKLYIKDAIYLQPSRPVIHGREGIRQAFGEYFSVLKKHGDSVKIRFKIERRTIRMNTAEDVGYYRIQIHDSEMDEQTLTGKFVTIVRQNERGEWLFHLDAFSRAPASTFNQEETKLNPGTKTIPFKYIHHIFVTASVNGETAVLLYDPVRNLILDRRYARSRTLSLIDGLEAGYGGPVTTGGAGSQQHEVLFTRDLVLNVTDLSFDFPLTPVIPLDSMMATALGQHVDGILGINILSDYVLEFDFPGKRFILHPLSSFKPPTDAVRKPITWMNRRPTILLDITIGDNKGTTKASFLLDFGMGGSVRFSTTYTDKEQLVQRLQPNIANNNEYGLGGALQSRTTRLPSLRIGDFELDSLVVTLAREKQGADADPAWDGLVGLRLMSRFTIYLDLSRDQIWFKPNNRFDRPSEYIDTGLGFKPHNRTIKNLTVRLVQEGSTAEETGFKVGDIISMVAGQPADQWHVRQWRETLENHVGSTIPVKVIRNGDLVRLELPLPVRL